MIGRMKVDAVWVLTLGLMLWLTVMVIYLAQHPGDLIYWLD